ncbi:MAG: hypothetical protein IPJ14_07820 [Kineosporiaceae bacterium]|nr:hypothetical protein [Kineosporiaceae bacterium]
MITDVQDVTNQDEVAAGETGGSGPPDVAGQTGPGLDAAAQQRWAEELVTQARTQGLDLASADRLLPRLTKRVLEAACGGGDSRAPGGMGPIRPNETYLVGR